MGPRHFMRAPCCGTRCDQVFVLLGLFAASVWSSNGGVTQFALCVPNLQQDYLYPQGKKDEKEIKFLPFTGAAFATPDPQKLERSAASRGKEGSKSQYQDTLWGWRGARTAEVAKILT
jgi:hypothetical protein